MSAESGPVDRLAPRLAAPQRSWSLGTGTATRLGGRCACGDPGMLRRATAADPAARRLRGVAGPGRAARSGPDRRVAGRDRRGGGSSTATADFRDWPGWPRRPHPGWAGGGPARAVPPAPRLPLDLARAALAGLRRRGEPGPRAAHRGRGLVAGRGDHRCAKAPVIAGGHATCWSATTARRVSRTRSAARHRSRIRPTWPATTRRRLLQRIVDAVRRPGSCTATCTGISAQLRFRLRAGPGDRAGRG